MAEENDTVPLFWLCHGIRDDGCLVWISSCLSDNGICVLRGETLEAKVYPCLSCQMCSGVKKQMIVPCGCARPDILEKILFMPKGRQDRYHGIDTFSSK